MHNSERRLHIVSFDNPYPPDYGGVIDVFYKLKALQREGIKITLHTFIYGRPARPELETVCEQVYYYERRRWVNPLSREPYIVASRKHPLLLQRLAADNDPVLFEGLHTTAFLDHPALRHKTRVVRTHNIEHTYYENLKQVSPVGLRKLYFHFEAGRLARYEPILRKASRIAAISPNDTDYLQHQYGHTLHCPPFHPNDSVTTQTGKGAFACYHGKLSVGENDEAARYLVQEVFSRCTHKLIIAGSEPTDALKALVNAYPHIELREGLNTDQIAQLVRDAHVNVLPTFQATGIKLKLINVLYQGRFALVNPEMVMNTGCEPLCTIAGTPDAFVRQLDQLFGQSFTETDLEKRKAVLSKLFDNQHSARILIDAIFQP